MIFSGKGKVVAKKDCGEGLFFVSFDTEKEVKFDEKSVMFSFDMTLPADKANTLEVGDEIEVEVKKK